MSGFLCPIIIVICSTSLLSFSAHDSFFDNTMDGLNILHFLELIISSPVGFPHSTNTCLLNIL